MPSITLAAEADLFDYMGIDPHPVVGDPAYNLATLIVESVNDFLPEMLNNQLECGLYTLREKWACGQESLIIPAYTATFSGLHPTTGSPLTYGTDVWVKIDGQLVPESEFMLMNGLLEFCNCCGARCCGCDKCRVIEVRYMAGYDPIPACLRLAALEMAAMMYETSIAIKRSTAGFSASSNTTGATGLIKSERIGKHTVVFDNFPSSSSSSSGGSTHTGCGCENAFNRLSPMLKECIERYTIYIFC